MPRKTLRDTLSRQRYAQPSVVMRIYGVGRSTIYNWVHDDLVRSALIRRGKGKSRKAIRLIDLESVEEFLAKHASGPQA
jgi:Helix-turn-helix domain